MMILSRIWYVILGLLLAAAYYVVSLAVGQYNRRNEVAMSETLKADSQVVSWAMQVDARRRLDALLLAAADPAVAKSLRAVNGKETVAPTSRDEAVKALRAFNEKLPAEYRNDALFATDRDGRVVAQFGYDAANGSPEFELGGYAAVFDALHGFLRDDTWVWGGRIARIVTRPVEDEVGQAPLGAVVGLRWVDNGFAKDIGKRTRTNIAFFSLGQVVARAATAEGVEDNTLEILGADLGNVVDDKGFKETGRTDVRPLGDGSKGGALFVRLPGEGWDIGTGFAVVEPKVSIATAMGFIDGADDHDKANVKLWVVALLVLGAGGIGVLFSFLEHSRPLAEMTRQAARLKKGEIDAFSLPAFRGGYRPIAADINEGIHRVVEKGGGTGRKPADLESILGPVPAQPSMSAFSFPMADASSSAAVPNVPSAPGLPPPAPSAPRPGVPSAAASAARPAPPARPNGPPPPLNPRPAAPTPAPAGLAPVVGGVGAFGSGSVAVPSFDNGGPEEEEERTKVGQPPADLLAASGGAADSAEWQQVYQDFVRTKRECSEPTDGLTYEKFEQTLKKNRDALIQRHGCKRVKFSVYVKEGRASLKATPVRD